MERIHIPSIHCTSCLKYIEATLSNFALESVQLDYKSKSVEFLAPTPDTITAVLRVLADNGYETEHYSGAPCSRRFLFRIAAWFNIYQRRQRKRHVQHCLACQSGLSHDEKAYDIESSLDKCIEDQQSSANVRKAQISISGMTCSSCTSTISTNVEPMDGIVSFDIHLMTNSAVAVYNADVITIYQLLETIEDSGYGTTLIEDSPLVDDASKTEGLRTLEIEFCGIDHFTISGVTRQLSQLGLISFTPVTIGIPISTIVYRPSSTLNIRHILNFDKPIQAFVHHRPSAHALSQENQRKEAKHLSILLLLAFLIAIPTFIIGVLGMTVLPSMNAFRMWCEAYIWGGCQRAVLALLVLATIAQLTVNQHFVRKAWKVLAGSSSRRWRWSRLIHFGNMDLLVALSTSIAYLASLGLLIRDVRRSPEDAIRDGTTTYFDSTVLLGFFILMGRVLEGYARSKTNDAISMLENAAPDHALLLSTTKNEKDNYNDIDLLGSPSTPISADLIDIGDLLLIPAGGMPCADGTVMAGSSVFDESSLTGESLPVLKAKGESVMTGTRNLSSPIVIRVETVGDETMMRKIVRAVAEGQSKKSPIQVLADKITSIFIPVVVYISLIVLVVWLSVFLSAPSFSAIFPSARSTTSDRISAAFEFAIAVLVIACPCGIGLAAPTAEAVGSGLMAKAGILAQGGGEAFQLASSTDIIVFDKTGTLTRGEATVKQTWVKDEQQHWLLEAVGLAEATSTHPLAQAITSHCQSVTASQPSSSLTMRSCEEIAGRGVRALFAVGEEPAELSVGNSDFVVAEAGSGFRIPEDLTTTATSWRDGGHTAVFVLCRTSQGISIPLMFGIADQLREGFMDAIQTLKDSGKEVYMLTGDNERTAQAVASQLGLNPTYVKAGALPHEKAQFITNLRQQKRHRHIRLLRRWRNEERNAIVAFMGDGLNDSAALAAADTGIAMSHGSQVSMAAASFVLLSDRSIPQAVTNLFKISARVHRRQVMNFCWAMLYNVVLMPVAAGVLYPYHHTRLSPVWSSLAMALSSVSVVISSLALQWGL
ncbi:E1-E2 ATPase-domain-containing protein [Crepidotus variabilis]|uniref:E1-E2 ATPase-domain-containing protein n=1 Tax=Crepidotus variabilis TaxID=179855 RepID=A0A9P6EIU9_9AGAR|nr:E1-E2 ATPase-domain-containing protein [Crepidotus variabilis]